MRTRRLLLGLFALSLGCATGSAGQAPPASRHPVSQADLNRWKTELSNWGRWGPDDQRGTLNLITPDKRRQAAALVREGFAVSLARDADTVRSVDNTNPYEQAMNPIRDAAATDRIAVSFHGFAHTHLDALGHHFIGGKMYNGFERDRYVSVAGGAQRGSIHNIKDGVFTRGILIDLPRLKGVPYLDPGTPVYVEDLEAWEKRAGVKISAGDAVFIRTGRWARRAAVGAWNVGESAAGLDPSVLPWLRQRDVALMGTEAAVDVVPRPSGTVIDDPDDYLPVHNFVLVVLGMPLIDDCSLEDLAAAAASRNRWEFLVTAAPLPVVNGTGSPINPTALF